MIDIHKLKELVLAEFSGIVEQVLVTDITELRILLSDGSFVDVWYSPRQAHKYSYHWERQHLDGSIYRHDNAPHVRWSTIETFPKHFHKGAEHQVEASFLADEPTQAIREFMLFVKSRLAD